MTPLETADILTAIASFDLRTVGEADIVAWHAVIGDLQKELALEAVVVHHKTNSERIKPAHLIGIAKQIRRERAERLVAGLDTEAPIPTIGQPVWPAYEVNDAITRKCPHCGAEPNDACIDPDQQRPTRIPCLARLKDNR